MAAITPLGLVIAQDIESKQKRSTDKRGYIDSDVPMLESFRLLKDGKPVQDFYMTPDKYREFIEWLLEGSIEPPIPALPMQILCYYRNKLGAGMDDVGTTDGNRLYQENIIKSINKMISGDDDHANPSVMCATGGAPPSAPPESGCCEEIMPKIDSINEALEEIKSKPAFDIKAELQKLLSGSTQTSDGQSGQDYSEKLEMISGKLEEIQTAVNAAPEKLDEIKALLEKGKSGTPGEDSGDGINVEDIVAKIKAILPVNEDLSRKIDALTEGLKTLTTIVTQHLATDIEETNTNVKSILEKLGEARTNISKLATNPANSSRSGLEIRAAQITEKAAKAAEEAEQAIKDLNLIKTNSTKSVDEIEDAVEKATATRDKADRLITEAQQLWDLIEPPTNNSSTAKGPAGPAQVVVGKANVLPTGSADAAAAAAAAPGKVVVQGQEQQPVPSAPPGSPQAGGSLKGGRGTNKNHEVINSAKSKINTLSASVLEVKGIIKARRQKNKDSSNAKDAELANLRKKIAAAEAELAELRGKIGNGGKEDIGKALELDAKVKALTELIKRITGETDDLEKGIQNHIAADSAAKVTLEELQARVAGLPNTSDIKAKLEAALSKIEKLESVPDSDQVAEIERLKAEVAEAARQHDRDEEEKRQLHDEISGLQARLAQLQHEYDSLTEKHRILNEEMGKKLVEIGELKAKVAEIDVLRAKIAELEGKVPQNLDDLRAQLAVKEQQLASLLAAIEELRAKKGSQSEAGQSEAGQSEEAEIDEKETEIAALRAEIEGLKAKIAALGKKGDQADEEGEKKGEKEEVEDSAALKAKLQELELELPRLKGLLTEKENALEELTGKFTRLTEEKTSAFSELAEKKATLSQLRESLSMSVEELQAVKAQVAVLKGEIRALNASSEQLTGEVADLREQLAEKSRALAHANEENDRLQQRIGGDHSDELSREIAEARAKVSSLEREKGELEGNLRAKDGELREITDQLSEKADALARSDSKHRDDATTIMDLQRSDAEKGEQLTAADARLQAALRDAAEQKRLAGLASQESSDLANRIAALTRRVEELTAESDQLRGKNARAQSNVQIQLATTTTDLQALRLELSGAKAAQKQAEGEALKASQLAERYRLEAADQKEAFEEAARELQRLSRECGGLTLVQGQLQALKAQMLLRLEELSEVKLAKGKSNATALVQQKRADTLQQQYDALLTKQRSGSSALDSKLVAAERTIAELSAQTQRYGRNSELLEDAQQELNQLRYDSQQLRLQLQSCGSGQHRLNLSNQFKPENNDRFLRNFPGQAQKKATPGYMASTASKQSRNAATSKQYGVRAHGGKKGARMTKTKKRITPLI